MNCGSVQVNKAPKQSPQGRIEYRRLNEENKNHAFKQRDQASSSQTTNKIDNLLRGSESDHNDEDFYSKDGEDSPTSSQKYAKRRKINEGISPDVRDHNSHKINPHQRYNYSHLHYSLNFELKTWLRFSFSSA